MQVHHTRGLCNRTRSKTPWVLEVRFLIYSKRDPPDYKYADLEESLKEHLEHTPSEPRLSEMTKLKSMRVRWWTFQRCLHRALLLTDFTQCERELWTIDGGDWTACMTMPQMADDLNSAHYCFCPFQMRNPY